MSKLNIHGVLLTNQAPTANYRGENDLNRSVIQKILMGGLMYIIISAEAIRNGLRETMIERGVASNRSRVKNAGQPQVAFKKHCNPEKFGDDFAFGYMVVQDKDQKEMQKENPNVEVTRNSILQVNKAVSTSPYEGDAILHQSPQNSPESPFHNSKTSALLNEEVAMTRFQYPFGINVDDCRQSPQGRKWMRELLLSIAEPLPFAGNHARSLFDFAPASAFMRVAKSPSFGTAEYPFKVKNDNGVETVSLPDLKRIKAGDLKGSEFWLGGEIVREMDPAELARLKAEGAHLYENVIVMIEAIADVCELK